MYIHIYVHKILYFWVYRDDIYVTLQSNLGILRLSLLRDSNECESYEDAIFISIGFYDCVDVYTCIFYKCAFGVQRLAVFDNQMQHL